MFCDLLNLLFRQLRIIKFSGKKLLLLLTFTIFSASVYADTCPATKEITFRPDGYFVAANGWRSEVSYTDIENPLLSFQSASYTVEKTGEKRFNGCRYGITKGLGTELMKMLPSVVVPFTVLEGNWHKFPHSGVNTCSSPDTEKTCRFIIGTTKNAKVSPFGHVS